MSCSIREPIVTPLDTIETATVDWLWPGRLARGKYTLFAGEPGVGKSYLMTDCASRVSRGASWADGMHAPLGTVLYLTAEDGIADTLRPRIERAGGDLSRVAVLEGVREHDGTCRPVSLTRDLDRIAQAVRDVHPVLVIIDPISAYLGRVDTHRDGEVRSALAPLVALMEQERCALAAVGHLAKDAQRAALHRPSGSIAFVAAARLVLAVAADPHDSERRLLAPLKSNLCRPAPVLAYRIGDEGLTWETDPVSNLDAEALLRPRVPGEREEQTDAEAVIRELLENDSTWPLDAREALEAGRAQGVPDRTMQWTAKRLGIGIRRLGFGRGGKWLWHRPTIPATTDTIDACHRDVAPMAPMQEHEDIRAKQNIDATKSSFPRAREEFEL